MAKLTSYDPALSVSEEEKSYFDGGFWGLLGHLLVAGFVTAITFGIALPWMVCYLQRWKTKHTVVCGKRMYFDGNGIQLIGKYMLWWLLSLITFGIYGFWMRIAIKKWVTKHTHYEGEKDNNSYFDGGIGGFIGMKILCFVLTWFTFGIGKAWADKKKIQWYKDHTVIDSRRHIFVGTGGNLFGKYLLWGFLSIITLGIFSLWVPIKREKWQARYTIDHEHTTDALIKRGEYRASVQAQAANQHTQRVQDEMELVKSGVTDASDQNTLLAAADAGNRAAQYEYVRRYCKNLQDAPYLDFLKRSARAGYAPAMSMYALSGLAGQERAGMLHGAAQKGQHGCIIAVMHASAKQALAMQDEAQALALLEESVRWFDVLQAGGEPVSKEDCRMYENCMMAIRRIKAKMPAKNKGVGAIIGACILAVIVLAASIAVVPKYMILRNHANAIGETNMIHYIFDQGLHFDQEGYYDAAIAGIDAVGQESFDDGYDDAYGDAYGYESEFYVDDPDIVLSDITYDDFMAALRANLEGDPNYYEITFMGETDNGDHYTMTCSHWYWSSYFDLYVQQYDGYVTRIEIDGPRVYEQIDENINGQEFQFLIKRMYEVLGLGPDGENAGIFIRIDPGTDGVQPFEGWEFDHNHTEDRLNIVFTPTED